jgi:V/A-type H+-transporting ATPase subunit E
MSEKLNQLLEKINREGVDQAQQKAKAIEDEARRQAVKITEEASRKAESIIGNANTEVQKFKDNAELTLKQAARDMLLSLKNEIRKTLEKIIHVEISSSLTSDDIAVLLKKAIDQFLERNGKPGDVMVLLKEEDIAKLKSGFIGKLKENLEEGIVFKPYSKINAGFAISFDKGKSFFDFTDEGLREVLRANLNPALSQILTE